jgi:DNA-binding MarR family transcriptional regulator
MAETGKPPIEATTLTSQEAVRLWLRLLSSANFIEREIQSRLRERFGISLARFDYLAQLDRAGQNELTMSDLGQKLMVSGGNITGLTDRLEKEGLVERRSDPGDRRVQRIALTERGRKLFADLASEHATWVADIFDEIGAGDAEKLSEILTRVKASADAAAHRRSDVGNVRKRQHGR